MIVVCCASQGHAFLLLLEVSLFKKKKKEQVIWKHLCDGYFVLVSAVELNKNGPAEMQIYSSADFLHLSSTSELIKNMLFLCRRKQSLGFWTALRSDSLLSFYTNEQQLHNLDCDWVVLKEAVTVKDLLLCMVLVSTQIRFAEVLNVSLLLVRKLMQRRHAVSLFLRDDSKDVP